MWRYNWYAHNQTLSSTSVSLAVHGAWLLVTLRYYALTHCSTCNADYSRCVHALGLQSIGGFDFDLLLWFGMLWRVMRLYCSTGVILSWIHATRLSSLCCGYECSCRLAWPWIIMDSDIRGGFFHEITASYLDRLRWVLWLFSVSLDDTWQLNSHFTLDRALDFFFL